MPDWEDPLKAAEERFRQMEPVLRRIADEVILPALGRNYDASGLKTRSGLLRKSITMRGARGNTISVAGNRVTVGVDYGQIPYARWALEGRGPVRAKRARFLHFFIDGKEFFRKSVGPAPAHDVYYLTSGDLARAKEIAEQMGITGIEVRAS